MSSLATLQGQLDIFGKLLVVVSNLFRTKSLNFSKKNCFIIRLSLVILRMCVVSQAIQTVAKPVTVSTLKQLVSGDVDLLLVDEGVLFVLCHVVALLAGDCLILFSLMATRPAVVIHLP